VNFKKKHIIFLIPISLFLGSYFIYQKVVENNYIEDNVDYSDGIYSSGPLSRVSEANAFVDNKFAFIDHISTCKQFPEKISDMYDPEKVNSEVKSCKALNVKPAFRSEDPSKHRPVWIDPWGRPYQIRYDRERRKLQVRSQGRYLWTESDDIVGETNMAIPVDMADAERAKCDSLPKDDMSCIFNRGWH